LTDVTNGIVSVDAARDIYGVIIDIARQQIDVAATEDLRTSLRRQRFQPV
jgi:hypothetical protein